jgi:putative endonuclease
VEASLVAEGWSVLARNWRGGGGELDRVVMRAGEIRFVKVKLRAEDDALAEDAVPRHKRSRLRGAARAWLEANAEQEGAPCAFHVAWVDGTGRIRRVDDAFDG